MERYERDFDRNRRGGFGGMGMWGERGGDRYGEDFGSSGEFQGGRGEFRGGRGEFGGHGGGYGADYRDWDEGRFGGDFGRQSGYGGYGGYGGGGTGGGYGGYGRGGQGGWASGFGGGAGQNLGGGFYGGGRGSGFSGGQNLGGGFSGGAAGYQGGYGGYTDYLDEQGYGGGWGGGWGQQRQSQRDDASRIRAADIMTENPETVTPETTLAEAAKKMRELDVGIIPVVDSAESRRLRGVVTDRDIAIRAVAEGKDGKTPVSEIMTDQVQACNKNDTVRDILNVMEREQVRRVPITDREGRLVGIVAQADVAVDFAGDRPERKKRVGRTLEQISQPAEPDRGARTGMQAADRGRGQTAGRAGGGRGGQQQRSEEQER